MKGKMCVMRLIYGFLCLAIVAGCQTTCDKVSASSAASNHVSVVAVRYMASVGGVGAGDSGGFKDVLRHCVAECRRGCGYYGVECAVVYVRQHE